MVRKPIFALTENQTQFLEKNFYDVDAIQRMIASFQEKIIQGWCIDCRNLENHIQ